MGSQLHCSIAISIVGLPPSVTCLAFFQALAFVTDLYLQKHVSVIARKIETWQAAITKLSLASFSRTWLSGVSKFDRRAFGVSPLSMRGILIASIFFVVLTFDYTYFLSPISYDVAILNASLQITTVTAIFGVIYFVLARILIKLCFNRLAGACLAIPIVSLLTYVLNLYVFLGMCKLLAYLTYLHANRAGMPPAEAVNLYHYLMTAYFTYHVAFYRISLIPIFLLAYVLIFLLLIFFTAHLVKGAEGLLAIYLSSRRHLPVTFFYTATMAVGTVAYVIFWQFPRVSLVWWLTPAY